MFLKKLLVYQKASLWMPSLTILLALNTVLFAQNNKKIDSLRSIYENGDDSYPVLWGLAYEIFDSNSEEALDFAQKAYLSAREYGSDSLIVRSGRLTGQLLRRTHRSEEAIAILLEVKKIADKKDYRVELARILNTLALCHTFMAEYDKALEYNFQSLVLREREGNKEQIAIALTNIGLTHYKMGSFDLALDYSLRSKRAYDEVGKSPEVNLLINIGLCFGELRRYKEAQEYFENALRVCGPGCNKEFIMQAEYGLATSMFQQKNYALAQEHFQKSLAISVIQEDVRFQLENLLGLAESALISNDVSVAKTRLEEVSRIPEVRHYRELLKGFYSLEGDYYSKVGDYKSASYYWQRVNEVNDSIFGSEVIKNLTRVQTQFAQRENLAIIAEKDNILALNQKLIVQQRWFNIMLGVIVILITVFVVVINRNYKRIKTVNAELATAKQIIEDHNKFLDQLVAQKTRELVNSNESLVKVNDELDNFIYKTSHDIRGPLASLKGMVNLAIMDVKDEKALGYLSKLDLTAEKLNMILTRLLIVNRINHAELKPETILFEPIIQEILTLEVKKGIPPKIKVDYEVAPNVNLVSDRDLVRLVLENLIDNAVKYYNDSERVESFVHIKVEVEDGKVTARVIDNGVGISTMNRQKIFQMFVRASERSDTGGIGLYLAKIATEKIGGDINLVTTGEKLTEFVVQFPTTLPKPADNRAEEAQRREAMLRDLQTTSSKA